MTPVLKFERDPAKDAHNQDKHGVSFEEAKRAFDDPLRIIAVDHSHSTVAETRYYCFGQVQRGIMTVRFTNRCDNIRIIGAGYWREGKRAYEEKNGSLH